MNEPSLFEVLKIGLLLTVIIVLSPVFIVADLIVWAYNKLFEL